MGWSLLVRLCLDVSGVGVIWKFGSDRVWLTEGLVSVCGMLFCCLRFMVSEDGLLCLRLTLRYKFVGVPIFWISYFPMFLTFLVCCFLLIGVLGLYLVVLLLGVFGIALLLLFEFVLL